MKNYKITTRDTNEQLFAGYFKDFKSCLEAAVSRRKALNNANLSHQNLSNANLDDGIFAGADFSGSNLSGANLSEAYCKGSNFSQTTLFNTCFAYSNLIGCNFQDASFGATDIAGALIDNSTFSTLSAFTLDFNKALQMQQCLFISHDNKYFEFSSPPITIHGLSAQPITLLENQILEGHRHIRKQRADHWSRIIQNLKANNTPIRHTVTKT